MKNLFLIMLSFLTISAVKAQCPNGDAESNSFSNWTTYGSASENPQNLNAFTPAFNPDRFGIQSSTSNYPAVPPLMVSGGIDQYCGIQIPSQGTYCFNLNANKTGGGAELMKYSFTVTNQNKNFKMRYAIVLQDGGHGTGENPAGWFYMCRGNTHLPILNSGVLFSNTFKAFKADLNDPFYKRSLTRPDIIYKNWECVEYDLSAYVGETVSFVAVARDCTQGAHFGYMYIDGLCDAWPATAQGTLNGSTFCLEQQIMLNASASEGEDSYFVEVAEVDANGNYYPNGSGAMVVNDWFVAQQAPSNFNVTTYLNNKGVKLKCGKKYKVKIAVANHCSPWNEKSMFFDIVCPQVNAGPDITLCCSSEVIQTDPIQIGSTAVPGNTYNWTSIPAGFTSTISNPGITPSNTMAYLVQMTQPNGCIGRDTVVVRFLPPGYTLSLTSKYKLCDYQPYVTAHLLYNGCSNLDQQFLNTFGYPDASFVKWYFKPTGGVNQLIGTGGTIHAPNADGILTATISTNCAPNPVSATMQLNYRPGGHEFIKPNTFTPNGDGTNDVFRILESGPNAPLNIGDEPAYGIEDFALRIYNRWGDNFRTITKADVGRLPDQNVRQGDISWDGKNNSGVVQYGSYVYTLEVKYCGSSSFERIKLTGADYDPCVRWIWLFCVDRVSGWASHVNVIQ
ncbi:gliding motility-associated C-terminal domain-containing protein [Fluviicola sp.]|uniref:T9SS type B sorting domain-containing protein n=1 Tax=Fluviicola sp. TaxID=1917219 RepID=UPI00260E31D4|nr:gliding motility-associated C-terminal domain-containing protein [Fluviicola sp.]